MGNRTVYYATNRRHEGPDRWRPKGYGTTFSSDGTENLRFGKATLAVDDAAVVRAVTRDCGYGIGDGNALAGLFGKAATRAGLRAYREKIDRDRSDAVQPDAVHGSKAMFEEIRARMAAGADVLVFVHGYNVSWHEALGSAAALQEVLNAGGVPGGAPRRPVVVVLFSWPSDGSMMPFAAYKSDRTDAVGSGFAVGRGFLKLRDFLAGLSDRAAAGAEPCGGSLHLLCHSMGNFVLENALARVWEHAPGSALPRIFDRVLLCAADVDDDALEPGRPLHPATEIGREVTVYFNHGDLALTVSDYTKGNPERLGTSGAAHPALLHAKVRQVDVTEIVRGFTEHSYFLDGLVNQDLRLTLAGEPADGPNRRRVRRSEDPRTWILRGRA
jgi:esterase/lipase superfamily enzyme